MSKLIDLTGQRFGDLVVLERDINKPKGRAYWICQCDCGKITSVLGTHLRQGNSKSRSGITFSFSIVGNMII